MAAIFLWACWFIQITLVKLAPSELGVSVKTLKICLLLMCGWFNQALASNGVILQYHHVADDTPPVTSVTAEQLRSHLQYLQDEGFNVLPLPDMIKALAENQPLPDKAVAITFDDGYRDILQNGHPILREFAFPYTIFVNPAQIGVQSDQLSWDDIALMGQQGVTFANHTQDHIHLLQRLPGEDTQQWLARIRNNILSAEQQLADKVGYSLRYLAYPYGEYDENLQALLREENFVGFAQFSGAISSASDFTALARFPAAGIYANLQTLRVKLNSLAMPVLTNSLSSPVVLESQFPSPQLTIDVADIRPRQFRCYINGDVVDTQWQENQVTVLSGDLALNPGRSRINCTAPSKQRPTRYYWFSQPLFKPDQNGRWRD